MAITSGAGPHFAWLNVAGATLPIIHGQVTQSAKRKTSSFHCVIAMDFPGAADTLASLGDNTATVSVLTLGQTRTLITGEVDATNFDFIGRKIIVTGRDKSAKLHDNKTNEKWQNKLPSDIVKDLTGRVGLSGTITSSKLLAGKKLVQDFIKLSDNVSYAYVIHRMAEFDGARWFVDPNGNFYYLPFNSPIGTYSLNIDQDSPIKSDCLSLMIKRNVQAGKAVVVDVKSWHPRDKQVHQYQSTVPGNGGPINYNYHIPTLTQDHVTQHARAQAAEKARHEFTVSATVVGDPTVCAGMSCSVNGTRYFDQTFEIDTVTHDIGMSGHRTHITSRAPKKGRSAS